MTLSDNLMSLLSADRFRQQITECAYQIDAALAMNPYEFGESRVGDTRIGFAPPLGALIEVDREL
jgi:hypothetical protein